MPDDRHRTVLGNLVRLTELDAMADQLLKVASPRVWCFHGDMGAGKTTFIKNICHRLGVAAGMTSPTFSIVNEYTGNAGQKIYHFDFYRLKKETEAYDIGVEEYFESGNYCFIEWPELIPSLVPQRHVDIWITVADSDTRTIAYTVYE